MRTLLFSYENSLLQVHGCIQQREVIICTDPSIKYNFIHVNLTKRLKVPVNRICNRQVEVEHVEILSDLKVTMDTYVSPSYFCVIDMGDMDMVFV